MNQEHPINIRLIDHVVIRVQNLVRMIDFYCDVLGCRLERGPGKNGLAQLRAGDSLIDQRENPIRKSTAIIRRTVQRCRSNNMVSNCAVESQLLYSGSVMP